MKTKETYAIIGLGNPDDKYLKTRHNIGFTVIDRLSEKINIPVQQKKFNALYGKDTFLDKEIYLIKPQTYMNRSGISVAQFKNYFRMDVENIWVIHDELDISVGQMKIKAGGNSAGHRGVQSMIDEMGNNQFKRWKIGIGKPSDNTPIEHFVLSTFSITEQPIMAVITNLCAESLVYAFDHSFQETMTVYNKKIDPIGKAQE